MSDTTTGPARRRRKQPDDMPDDDTKQPGPVRAALRRLVQDGTLTEEQAKAVRRAVRDERRARKGA
jgi:hypothetical protein